MRSKRFTVLQVAFVNKSVPDMDRIVIAEMVAHNRPLVGLFVL